ncbi:hypothetical protein Ga0003345_0591 [Idiomarinaceae bacterium HL-53]|nr:hypothetical protein Ga0003345_0591 [Idiomarinaceae bacterium HL-53]
MLLSAIFSLSTLYVVDMNANSELSASLFAPTESIELVSRTTGGTEVLRTPDLPILYLTGMAGECLVESEMASLPRVFSRPMSSLDALKVLDGNSFESRNGQINEEDPAYSQLRFAQPGNTFDCETNELISTQDYRVSIDLSQAEELSANYGGVRVDFKAPIEFISLDTQESRTGWLYGIRAKVVN